jgi:hypothetical protein
MVYLTDCARNYDIGFARLLERQRKERAAANGGMVPRGGSISPRHSCVSQFMPPQFWERYPHFYPRSYRRAPGRVFIIAIDVRLASNAIKKFELPRNDAMGQEVTHILQN